VNIYVGDAPLTTPGSVLKYNPAVAISATNPTVYSLNVPAYKAGFDGVTRSQYVGIRGVAFAPNGDLYVADDPTASLVLPVLPTKQGNLWRVPYPATPLSVLTYAPASGLGRAFRSSFPFTVSGNSSRCTNPAGTMYSGKLPRKCLPSSSAPISSPSPQV